MHCVNFCIIKLSNMICLTLTEFFLHQTFLIYVDLIRHSHVIQLFAQDLFFNFLKSFPNLVFQNFDRKILCIKLHCCTDAFISFHSEERLSRKKRMYEINSFKRPKMAPTKLQNDKKIQNYSKLLVLLTKIQNEIRFFTSLIKVLPGTLV